MPDQEWDPIAGSTPPPSTDWNPLGNSSPKPKFLKKLQAPPSLPDVQSRNFPKASMATVEPDTPEILDENGQQVPASVQPSPEITAQVNKGVNDLKGWVENTYPWARAGITRDQYNAMSYGSRVKLGAKNALNSTYDAASQIQTAPIRAVAGLVRGAVGLGQMALENIDNGTTTSLVDKGLTPAGTAEGEWDPIMPAGIRTVAGSGTVTGASLSKDLSNVQLSAGAWMDARGLTPKPTTPEGEVARVTSDVGLDASLATLVPGSTFATRGTALAGLLGGRATGQTFNEATDLGLPLEKKNQAALGEGALNAGMVAIPLSHAFEGSLGLKSLASRLPLGAAEGWGIGQLSNATREHAGLPVDNSPMAQLTSALQGAGMKAMQPVANPTKTFNDLPNFTGETPIPEQQTGQTVGGLERLLASAPDRRLGSQAIARNYFDVLGKHPDEVMREVRDYHDAQVAGIQPPTVSPEAQTVLDSPAWKQLMADQTQLRDKLQVLRGLPPDADPNHIPRVITEGVDPSAPANASKMRTGANSDLARTLYVAQDPLDPTSRKIVVKGSPEAAGQKLVPATSAEIEDQTGISVRQNPVQSVIDNNIQMQTAIDNRNMVNQINNSQFAVDGPKDGFVPLEGDAKKVFDPQGIKTYDPRIKEMIDKSLADHADPNILDKLNRGIVQFGFANPTVHTPNVINHGYVSGMLKIASDPKMAMEAQDRASDAVESIMQGRPNADAVQVMRAGGRIMVPDQILARNAENRDAGEKSINTQAREASFGNMADQFNVGKDGALGAINNMNQKYTWATDSKARLFNYFLYQAKTGAPLADSIHEVDRAVYPNYRQTYNEMEGTGTVPQVANAASNFAYNTPGISLFGSYNKAATKIATLMAKDLGPADPTIPPDVAAQRRSDAASHVAATVIGLGLVYPALGKALQGMEGTDQEKEAFIGGSAHKTQLFLKAVEGKDWVSASRIAGVNINPVTALGAYANGVGALRCRAPNSRDLMDAQSFAANGDLDSAGKALKNWGSDAVSFGGGVLNYAAPQVADALAGKKDLKTVVMDQLTRGKNVSTDAEKLYNRFYSDKAPQVQASWDKADEEDARKAMGKAVKDGDFNTLGNVISSGSINPDLVEKTIGKLNMPKEFQLAAKAKGLSFEDQIRLWRVATPEEQKAMLALGLGDEIVKHAEPKDNMPPAKLMNTKAFIDNWVATRKL